MSKNFNKWTLGNKNFFKLLKIFLLRPVEISFFNRLYLRNGASWTPQTFDGWYTNFRSSIQIRWQNFTIRFNKKIEKFFNFFEFFGLEVKAMASQVPPCTSWPSTMTHVIGLSRSRFQKEGQQRQRPSGFNIEALFYHLRHRLWTAGHSI